MNPYAECSIGSHQSPVDLSSISHERPSDSLRIDYKRDMSPDFFNSAHAAQVNLPSTYPDKLFVNRDAFPLIQFHFHAPAEHVIGSKTFPAELHFVHIRADGKMAVLGVLLDAQGDKENTELQKVLDNMPRTPATHDTNSGAQLRLSALLPTNKVRFFSYAGSLTTPPCSEGVDWYVLAEPLKISNNQLAELVSFSQYLEGAGLHNNRFPQNLNGRVVMLNSH
jgi:carbonic anhydrase